MPHNSVGDEGAKHVAEALRVNSALRRLDVGGNAFGAASAEALAAMVRLRSMPIVILTGLKPLDIQAGNDRAHRLSDARHAVRQRAVLWAVARLRWGRGGGM